MRPIHSKSSNTIYELLAMLSVTRTIPLSNIPSVLRPIVAVRLYATQTGLGTTASKPKRKAVTAFNDDGRVSWGELSTGEKLARTTQQTFNFSFIIVGAVLTVSPCYSCSPVFYLF